MRKLVYALLLAVMSGNCYPAVAFDGFNFDEIFYTTNNSAGTMTLEASELKSSSLNSSRLVKHNVLIATDAHHSTDYKKVALINGRQVETAVRMWQPRGTGFGGAFPLWNAVIKLDGKTVYDAQFGHNHVLDVDINKIVLQVKGSKIEVTWVAEIDDSSHVDNLDVTATPVTNKTFKKLKTNAVGLQ